MEFTLDFPSIAEAVLEISSAPNETLLRGV
jgi:hypothetical protein